ncbi:MAG TPA: sigma-70 family RNA polymerase sigma factor [Candidatus Acidoferrum sp.]|nr:sigma-70 family RNA polymerase sigma factor [Candidatus Acidoferrum sp.]
MPQPPQEKKSSTGAIRLLAGNEALAASLYSQSAAARWGLSQAQFICGLERSLRKRFEQADPSPGRLEEYLLTLHLADLVLTTACIEGSETAWEYFVAEYRGYLRAAAGAITKSSRYGANPQELADSLFSDLFGLMDGKRGERSLFRYYHGRSSLKTWLRTVLAQRHVDYVRSRRRLDSLDAEDGEALGLPPQRQQHPPLEDPHRAHYLSCFSAALRHCLKLLPDGDRERLELYYVRQIKLAEIGRQLGEHESSVSRSLERIRQELRALAEQHLRDAYSLSDAEIQQCFEYAAEDVPIDFRQLFPEAKPGASRANRKEPA